MKLITLTVLISVSVTAYEQISYEKLALYRHNLYRRMHNYADLEYSEKLGALAFLCARYYSGIPEIDRSCIYKSSYGENFSYFGGSTDAPDVFDSVLDAIDGWYAESFNYDYAQPRSTASEEIYHFTQMIWKSTFQMGFGVFRNNTSKRTFVVALYNPSGNVLARPPDSFRRFRGNVTVPVKPFQPYDFSFY